MDAIIDDRTKVLVVGTFPSVLSLKSERYYDNPRNQFWKLMSDILDIDLIVLDYSSRIKILLSNGIGLWDTIRFCDREGSMDANIKNEEFNDFSKFKNLKKIVCNGTKARKNIDKCKVPKGIQIFLVPSSSPARAMRFEDKLSDWREVFV